MQKPIRPDYRAFRLDRLREPQFRHMRYLVFWPIFGLAFLYVERIRQVSHYTAVRCFLDDMIPFQEWFLLPYLGWFVFLIGMLLYTFFFDAEEFARMMRFIIITYGVTMAIYMIWPTCQQLRPTSFERDNVLTRFIDRFYRFDTDTNVCPSIHVLGAVAVVFAAWHTQRFAGPVSRLVFLFFGALISVSTVFMKQHSALDVLAAAALAVPAGFIVYPPRKKAR